MLLQQHGVHPPGDRGMGKEEREPGLDLILGEDLRVRRGRLHAHQYTQEPLRCLHGCMRVHASVRVSA